MARSVCEEKTFKELYYEHSEYLRNFMFYKTGNLSNSEDIVQESFCKLWENCAKVSCQKAKSFLFTVANNIFLNKVKHEKVVLAFANRSQKNDHDVDPQYLLEEKEFKQRLELAISNLTEAQRVVFLMNRIDKKKYKEIAEVLNISVKAVEKRMHKALKELRKIHKNV